MAIKYKSLFNEEKRQFEVWQLNEDAGYEALLLTQTVEEVNEMLVKHIMLTLDAIAGA